MNIDLDCPVYIAKSLTIMMAIIGATKNQIAKFLPPDANQQLERKKKCQYESFFFTVLITSWDHMISTCILQRLSLRAEKASEHIVVNSSIFCVYI